jgi:hypothetical protein
MAAGLGYIEFATGDILTAAAANGYLASQTVMVFANAAARTAAITSPQEGMFSYLKDTNATEYYSGSAWVALGGGGSSGKVAQVLSTTKTDTFTLASSTFTDITGLSVSITPTSATSKILVSIDVLGNGAPASGWGGLRIMRDSTPIGVGATAGSRVSVSGFMYVNDGGLLVSTSNSVLDSPATTSAITYKVQFMTNSAGTGYINRTQADTDSNAYPRGASTITVMEITA